MRIPYPRFTSEGTFLLVALGVTLGTGNVWRMPRLIAEEGGIFLVPWVAGLVVWSYPLLLAELAVGRRTGLGLVGAFARLRSGREAWVGTMLVIAAVGALCFTALASGWCLAYFLRALTRDLLVDDRAGSSLHHLETWASFVESWSTVPYLVIALAVAWIVVTRGVTRGLERAHLVLVPLVFAVLFLLAARGLALPGSGAALAEAFHLRPARLLDPDLWFHGLAQAAWSTAAGWGWLTTYATSMPADARPPRIAARVVGGSAFASLLMCAALLPMAFGPDNPWDVRNDALLGTCSFAFVWIPSLLAHTPWGSVVGILFYVALAGATLLTLIALLETITRVGLDLGGERTTVATAGAAFAAVLALPGALRMDVLAVERWIFEVLLILGAGLFAVRVARYGARRLHGEVVGPHGAGATFFATSMRWLPVGAAVLAGASLLTGWRGQPTAIAIAGVLSMLAIVALARAFTPDLLRTTFAADLEPGSGQPDG